MIEPKGNEGIEKKATYNKNDICLRFNVSDIKRHCDELLSSGIRVDIEEYEWGTVGRFKDPDGNKCSLKDSEKFEAEIKDYIG